MSKQKNQKIRHSLPDLATRIASSQGVEVRSLTVEMIGTQEVSDYLDKLKEIRRPATKATVLVR